MEKVLRLCPAFKDYIWGGERLKTNYGKKTDLSPCAESWELSYHPDGLTKTVDGKALCDLLTESDLGENAKAFPFFPMLIKFIDARDNLSVQVHPSDDYALSHENSFGKTEMWHILEAEEGAGIYLGFKKDVSKEEFEDAIAKGRLTELLNFYPVKAGETYFIPSGTLHAIGRGCLICEIQQNSNLTYRVYDYGRVGKDGKPRELHVEKALKVTNRSAFSPKAVAKETPDGTVIGCNKYFHVLSRKVAGKVELDADPHSFRCLTVVDGSGKIGSENAAKGDSFFLSAGASTTLEGNFTMIVSSVRKYYVGIDLGGTFIKGGIVDDLGNLLVCNKIPTKAEKGSDGVANNIASLALSLIDNLGLTKNDVSGIGIGVPGMIDSAHGEVTYSNNLGWNHFKISDEIERITGLPVKIANDANVAALGESKFGGGKGFEHVVMITLGTGVGGGIIIGGKLFEGNLGAGAELGHMVIREGGEICTCGRRGCFEAYSSATALIRDTKRAMEAHKDSKMWEVGSLDAVDGRTAFAYLDSDPYAKEVVDGYIHSLGFALTNIANIFRPQVILIGGGICAEGKRLTDPLQKIVDRDIFGGDKGPSVPIRKATLANRAGILGAAALLMD